MLGIRKRNLRWADIDMIELELSKLILHYAQANRAEGKSPKTISWYSEMLSDFAGFLASKGNRVSLSNFNVQIVREFIVHEQERGLSPFSVQGKVRASKERDMPNANAFISDLASRLDNRIQLNSDGLKAYVDAVEASFHGEAEPIGPGRYSPPKVSSVDKMRINGKPDMELASTSYVERGNLTMRMCIRRFTRLTNAFSKKLENLEAAVKLHFAYYNLVRFHKTLRMPPALYAGVTNHIWTVDEIVKLII